MMEEQSKDQQIAALREHVGELERVVARRDEVIVKAREKIKQLLQKIKSRDALIQDLRLVATSTSTTL